MSGQDKRCSDFQEIPAQRNQHHSNSTLNRQHCEYPLWILQSHRVTQVVGTLEWQYSHLELLNLLELLAVFFRCGHIPQQIHNVQLPKSFPWSWRNNDQRSQEDNDCRSFRIAIRGRGFTLALILQKEDASSRKTTLLRQSFLHGVNHWQEWTHWANSSGFH